MVSPAFLNPGAGTLKLSDVKPIGFNELEAYGEVHLDVLRSNGATDYVTKQDSKKLLKQYFWQDNEDEDIFVEYGAGWYDGDNNPMKDGLSPLGNADEIDVDVGGAFWTAEIGTSGKTVQFAGEVKKTPTTVTLNASGFKLVGNPYPVDYKLSDIQVSGFNPLEAYGEVHIDILRSNGATDYVVKQDGKKLLKQYFYQDNEDEDIFVEYGAGWYDGDNNPMKDGLSPLGNADEVVFRPGEGMWVGEIGATGKNLVFPVPAALQ